MEETVVKGLVAWFNYCIKVFGNEMEEEAERWKKVLCRWGVAVELSWKDEHNSF